jgi:nucleotide-binding universal stress UspA family protein
MFSYLFPEWKELPTAIVSINPRGDNGSKYDDYLEAWLPGHFSNIEKVQLEGNLQKELTKYIGKQDADSIVIMGSYGGNAMSRMFHKSLSNVVLEETFASLFIVHE